MDDEYPISSALAAERVAARVAIERPAYVPEPSRVIVARRDAADDELAGAVACRRVLLKAQAHGWTVRPTYARARAEHRQRVQEDRPDEDGKGSGYTMALVQGELETIALRMSRSAGRERAVVVYARKITPEVNGGKWAFDLAYTWGQDHPISRRSSSEVAAYLTQSPVDQLVEACAA